MYLNILGHNFSTVRRAPTMSGYAPTISKVKKEVAQGNWFPRFYISQVDINPTAFMRWGMRYLWVPSNPTQQTWEILH